MIACLVAFNIYSYVALTEQTAKDLQQKCTAMLKSQPIKLLAHAQTHDSSIYDIYTAAQSVIYTSDSASALYKYLQRLL